MATSDNCYFNYFHFPDESFRVFESSKGTVPRADIENINISEMIENKDFHLLKTNLLAITNFNLEDEYDLRVLDDNLVKLFRLAQLGITYLTQRESYLTKFIVMLQEEVKELKRDRKPFKQRSAQSIGQVKSNIHHQCKECGKVFITDMYLRCHEKRRHAIPPKEENPSVSVQKTPIGTPKQSTHSEASPRHHGDTETWLKRQSQLKIKNLEKEVHDLKHRLAITEKSIRRKENSHSRSPSPPEASPRLVPAYFSSSLNVQSENGLPEDPLEKSSLGNGNVAEEVKTTELDFDKRFSLKEGESTKGSVPGGEEQEKDRVSIPWSPQPFPRKTKKRNELNNKGNSTSNFNSKANTESNLSSENRPLEKHLIPLKTSLHSTAGDGKEDREEIKRQQKTVSIQPTSGSLIKKLIRGSSPTIAQLKNNFKRSLTNLYESVASNGRESQKEAQETQEFNDSHSTTSEMIRLSGESIRHRVKAFGKNQRKSVGKVAIGDNKGHGRDSLKGFARSYFSFSGNNPKSKDLKEQEQIENGPDNEGKGDELKGNISTSKTSHMYDVQMESDCDSLPHPCTLKEDATQDRIIHNINSTVHRQPPKEFDFSVFQVTKVKEELNELLNEPKHHHHEAIEVVPGFKHLRLDHGRDDEENTPS